MKWIKKERWCACGCCVSVYYYYYHNPSYCHDEHYRKIHFKIFSCFLGTEGIFFKLLLFLLLFVLFVTDRDDGMTWMLIDELQGGLLHELKDFFGGNSRII